MADTKVEQGIINLIAETKASNNQSKKDAAAAISQEKKGLNLDKANAGRLAAQFKRMGLDAKNQTAFQQAESKIRQREMKIQTEQLNYEKQNTGFFSVARQDIKNKIKENKAAIRDEKRQAKYEARSNTLLGRMANGITDAFGPKNKGEEEEKAKEADAKQSRILGVLGSISGGITGLAKSSMSLAGKGLKGGIGGLKKLLAGTLFAGLFAVVFAFLNSEQFAKVADFIGNKVLPALINFYEGVIKPAFDAVVDFLMNDAFPAIGKFMTETVLPILKDFYDNILVPTFGFLIDFFKEKIWPAMKDFISESSGKISEFYENTLKPAFLAIGDFAQNQFFPALGDIFQKLKDTYTKIKPSLDALFNFLTETTLPALFETAKKNFENVKDIVMKVIDFAGNIISGDFGAAFDDLMDIGGLIAKTIDDTITGILKAVGLDFEGNISDVIGNFFTGIYDSITGTVNGIMNSIEGIIRAVPGIGNTVADTLFGELTPQEIAVRDMKKVEEEKAKIREEIANEQARIARSESGVDEYGVTDLVVSEKGGQEKSAKRIAELQKQIAEQDAKAARLKAIAEPETAETVEGYDEAAYGQDNNPNADPPKKMTKYEKIKARQEEKRQRMQTGDYTSATFDPKKAKGFAKGGLLDAGRLALVGEKGPELIFSKTDAQVKTSQQTDRLLNAAINRDNEQSAPVILNAPTVAPQVSNVSNTNAGISYIANPDPIFQRSSAFAI